MLEWVLQLAPMVVGLGALAIVATTLRRRRTRLWLRFQEWVSSSGPWPPPLYFVIAAFLSGLLVALGGYLARVVTGTSAWTFTFAIAMTIAATIAVALFSPIFKAQKEPEDWLLWDKERTGKR